MLFLELSIIFYSLDEQIGVYSVVMNVLKRSAAAMISTRALSGVFVGPKLKY